MVIKVLYEKGGKKQQDTRSGEKYSKKRIAMKQKLYLKHSVDLSKYI